MTTRPPFRFARVLFAALILVAAAYAIIPDEPTAKVPLPVGSMASIMVTKAR